MPGRSAARVARHLTNLRGARALKDRELEVEKLRTWLGSEKNTMNVEELTRVLLYVYSELRPDEEVFNELAGPYIVYASEKEQT